MFGQCKETEARRDRYDASGTFVFGSTLTVLIAHQGGDGYLDQQLYTGSNTTDSA